MRGYALLLFLLVCIVVCIEDGDAWRRRRRRWRFRVRIRVRRVVKNVKKVVKTVTSLKKIAAVGKAIAQKAGAKAIAGKLLVAAAAVGRKRDAELPSILKSFQAKDMCKEDMSKVERFIKNHPGEIKKDMDVIDDGKTDEEKLAEVIGLMAAACQNWRFDLANEILSKEIGNQL